MLYGALLSGFFGLVILVIGFISYRSRRIMLQRLAEEITLSADNIPLPRNGIEEDYTRLIHTIYDTLKVSENEAAERLSDMTDYYTMWVHQIKTPIAAMGLILQSGDSPEYSELSENLQRIEQYAEMVLCYLRLDSDSSDLVIREYDLDNIVRQAVRKYSSQFIRRRLKLIYEPLDKTILTDEKWLLFVIEQVISNAIKYTPAGEVEIYCEEPLSAIFAFFIAVLMVIAATYLLFISGSVAVCRVLQKNKRYCAALSCSGVMYTAVYVITSGSYYKIVSGR
ncbi:MAG: sensor histidine kinase [Huintestinicola sp.]